MLSAVRSNNFVFDRSHMSAKSHLECSKISGKVNCCTHSGCLVLGLLDALMGNVVIMINSRHLHLDLEPVIVINFSIALKNENQVIHLFNFFIIHIEYNLNKLS